MRRLLALCAAVGLALGPALADSDGLVPPGLWHPDPDRSCLPAPVGADLTPQQKRLSDLVQRIEAVAPGPDPLLATIRAQGLDLCIVSREMDALGYFAPLSDRIYLSEQVPDPLLFVIVVHEGRHADQYQRGYCPSTDYSVDEILRMSFAIEADAQAVATLYAWQARERGDSGPWDTLVGLARYSNIADAFDRGMAETGSAVAATARAFDAWYDSAILTTQYFNSVCGAYYDTLDDRHLNPSYELLPEGFFDNLCRLPTGEDYPCEPRAAAHP